MIKSVPRSLVDPNFCTFPSRGTWHGKDAFPLTKKCWITSRESHFEILLSQKKRERIISGRIQPRKFIFIITLVKRRCRTVGLTFYTLKYSCAISLFEKDEQLLKVPKFLYWQNFPLILEIIYIIIFNHSIILYIKKNNNNVYSLHVSQIKRKETYQRRKDNRFFRRSTGEEELQLWKSKK